jgi:hypothetical protein
MGYNFKNSWGGGAYIWDSLAVKYLGWERSSWLSKLAMGGKDGASLWELAGDGRLSDSERIALCSTTDRVMVRKENLHRVAEAFRDFVRLHPPGDSVCSLLNQADSLMDLSRNDECFAVCWNQSSCADSWHDIELPEPDDDGNEYRTYDISVDSDHWFMFDELGANGDPLKGPDAK